MPTRSEQIEREIEDKRRDMSRTAAEIERRLRAENLVDGAVTWFRTSPGGRAMADDVVDVVSRNPLPVVLIGIGVLWMAYEMTRSGGSRTLDRYTPMRRRMGPNVPADRHHAHVESGGAAATPGRAPHPDELLGRVRSGQAARDAAEAFRQAGHDDQDEGGANKGDPAGRPDGRPEKVAVYDTDTGETLASGGTAEDAARTLRERDRTG